MYPCAIDLSAAGPAAVADEDLRFLDQQAKRYLADRPWQALEGATVALRLKAGSWYEACAQPLQNDDMNVVFLFPGRRDLHNLQQAGMGEPPAGTVFAELHAPEPRFQVITPEGWLAPDRLATRVMALALAAISALGANPHQEARGEVSLPGGVRGRFVASVNPKQDDNLQLLMGVVRTDLYGEDGDSTLTLLTPEWPAYEALRARAVHFQSAGEPFSNHGEPLPVMILSETPDPTSVTAKLREADALGVKMQDMGGVLGILVAARKTTYLVTQVDDEREAFMSWAYYAKLGGGAHALVVTDASPNLGAQTPEVAARTFKPPTVYGVFEFGKQGKG